VAYDVEFVEPVLDYLANVPRLTDQDRAVIVDGVIEELSRDADHFHALRPLAHESMCFLYDYPHQTRQALFNFDFVVDATHANIGVVRIVYVECTIEPMG
jgi:hypothetical protein